MYAHHDPYTLIPGGAYPYTDQGEQVFTLRLWAGQGLSPLDAFHLVDELTCPPVATPHVSRVGQGPQHASLLPIEARSSVATWLKATEDRAGLIVRVLEADGKPDTVVLPASADRRAAPGRGERSERSASPAGRHALAPYALTTLRMDQDGRWRLSDGLES